MDGRLIERTDTWNGRNDALPGWDVRVFQVRDLRKGDFVTVTTDDDRHGISVALQIVRPAPRGAHARARERVRDRVHARPRHPAVGTLFEAATKFRSFRLFELFCGFPREATAHEPVRYPAACSPQAWAAGALPPVRWSLLGLEPDAGAHRLHVRRPRLPD